jgi:O-methyltransferase domain
VGGGSGVVSLALLQRYPDLRATVVDIANVCRAGREIAARQPEGDRIAYHMANFVEDELPQGFDIVMFCDVGIFYDGILAKLAASLNEPGLLVIVDRWFDEGQQETPERLASLLARSLREPDYVLRSPEDVEEGLARAGLVIESIVELNYGSWKMIQARRNNR